MKNKYPRVLMLVVLFLCLFLRTHICVGADTISANHSLSGDQTIVSAGGIFELGFHKPGNSSNHYICLWYKQISERIILWVANREKPISDRFSSVLTISHGNLVLFDESQIPIWSTDLNSTTSSSVIAVLRDDGNLILTESANFLWQSFDNPTHAWLPGSKIAYNNVTKRKQRLISWKNKDDPAPGLYSLELDTSDNSYRILWNRSKTYWTSGPWNGKYFDKVPEMGENKVFDYEYVIDVNESYFVYYIRDNSTTYRLSMIDVSGQIKQLNWLNNSSGPGVFWAQPREQCAVYAFCGAFGSCNENAMPFCNCLTGFVPKSQSNWDLGDYSGGCQRKTKLMCGNNISANGVNHNGERDKFVLLSSMSLPEHAQPLKAASTVECESTCLNDCSCTAYAFDGNNCSIWIKDLLNLKQTTESESTGKNLYVRLAASELTSSKENNNGIVIGVIVGGVAGLAVLIGLVLLVILTRRRNKMGHGKAVVEGNLVAFDYRYLQNATKNFSQKLGGGGFGSVFKGTLPDSTVIAVKQLQSVSQGEKQFRAEVSTIGTIQHVNLVRLRGFCSQGTKRLLVYDYMPNGSLDSHLFHKKNLSFLEWETRYQIALGSARALLYLHEKCRDCIIHCDVKPDNVLLDAEFRPKVADFGMAKLVGRNFSRVLTTMRGTRGYLAPEWISGAAITSKADVYSYGMMLFEFVSGRRNSEYYVEGELSFFPVYAANVIIEGHDAFSLLDSRLEGKANEEQLIRVCRVACWCIQGNEAHRPSMGHIVQILEGIINVNLPPFPRLFQVLDDNPDDISFFSKSYSG